MRVRRREGSDIFVHNPIGFGFRRPTKNLTVLKHKDPFLTNLLAITSLSHDIHSRSSFLPETRLGSPALSLSSVMLVLLTTKEVPNLICRVDPRLVWIQQLVKNHSNQKLARYIYMIEYKYTTVLRHTNNSVKTHLQGNSQGSNSYISTVLMNSYMN